MKLSAFASEADIPLGRDHVGYGPTTDQAASMVSTQDVAIQPRLFLCEHLQEERLHVLMRLLHRCFVVACRRAFAHARVLRREGLLRDGVQNDSIVTLFERAVADR